MDNETKENNEILNDIAIESNPASDFLNFLWDLVKTAVIVFIIAFSIRYFLIQPFIVEGGSMLPNFTDNEYLLAEKLSYIIGQPKRGDAIIFKYPKNPSQSYIKRVIGLPGETVEISNNKITIINSDHPSGVILSEIYMPSNQKTLAPNQQKFRQILSDGEYFVLGDNREHSSDSREWGIMPEENIIGRAWLTIRPLDQFGVQKRIKYDGLSYFPIVRLALLLNPH